MHRLCIDTVAQFMKMGLRSVTLERLCTFTFIVSTGNEGIRNKQ